MMSAVDAVRDIVVECAKGDGDAERLPRGLVRYMAVRAEANVSDSSTFSDSRSRLWIPVIKMVIPTFER
jgi:hypothetical protein